MAPLDKRREWTEAELYALDELYGVIPTAALARRLGRSVRSVYKRAYLARQVDAKAAGESGAPAPASHARVRVRDAERPLRRNAEKRIAAALDAHGVGSPAAELAAHLICAGVLPGVDAFLLTGDET